MATQTPRGGRGCTLLARADARFSLPDHSSDADVATPLYGKSVGTLSVAWLPATRWATSSLRPPSAAGSLRRALRFKRQRADVGEGDRGLRVGREWSRCHGFCLGENRRCRVRAWHKCRSHRAVRDAREWRSITSRGALRAPRGRFRSRRVGEGGAGGRGTLRSVSTIRSLRLRIPTLVSRSASRAPGPASADDPQTPRAASRTSDPAAADGRGRTASTATGPMTPRPGARRRADVG
jgi:hypothetical protein